MLTLTRPLAVLDIESTGLDITRDRIIDLAVVVMRPGTPTRDRFSWRFNPEMPIPAQATAIHGITDKDVEGCRSFKDKAEQVFGILRDVDIAGFNILGFDTQMLWEEFYRANLEWDLTSVAMVDAGLIFKLLEPRSLEFALPFYTGKKHEGAHGAMADTEATIKVLEAQLDGGGQLLTPERVEAMTFENRERYKALSEMTVQQLSDFCAVDRDGNRRLDLAGIVVMNKDGVPCYTHKKVRGVPVKDDPGYGEWILSKDFPTQSKKVLSKILSEIYESANLL